MKKYKKPDTLAVIDDYNFCDIQTDRQTDRHDSVSNKTSPHFWNKCIFLQTCMVYNDKTIEKVLQKRFNKIIWFKGFLVINP